MYGWGSHGPNLLASCSLCKLLIKITCLIKFYTLSFRVAPFSSRLCYTCVLKWIQEGSENYRQYLNTWSHFFGDGEGNNIRAMFLCSNETKFAKTWALFSKNNNSFHLGGHTFRFRWKAQDLAGSFLGLVKLVFGSENWDNDIKLKIVLNTYSIRLVDKSWMAKRYQFYRRVARTISHERGCRTQEWGCWESSKIYVPDVI